MNKSRIVLLIVIFCFAACALFGTAFSAWVYTGDTSSSNAVLANVPSWTFEYDTDFAVFDNIYSCTNLVASRETTLTQGSFEAIRVTSTTGTSTRDHIINIDFDRDYYLSEIRYYKFEFDYHHRYKREQYTKGFPTVQFVINHSTLGTSQGGTDTCEETSAFNATQIDENWWHLEYYIYAHIPTLSNKNHGNTPISLTKKINGVRINDRTMYDYKGTTAYAVIDNMQFSSETCSKLGIFNRYVEDNAGKYFWLKVAFAGELNSVVLSSSDTNVAVPEFSADDTVSTTYPFPNGSPFDFYLVAPGTVTLSATLDVGPEHRIMSISYTLLVK